MSQTLSLRTMITAALRGLAEARQRYKEARGLGSVVIPLSEALYWITVLDEAFRNDEYERERQDHPEGVVIPGLRYARNLHTHELVAATTLRGGLTVPFRVPFSIQVHIVWRRVEDLPDTGSNSKHKNAQRQSYADHLAGRSPALTLEHAAQWLRIWRDQSGM